MQIRVINPNTTAAMTAKIGEAAKRAAAPETRIVATNPASGPVSVESHFDEAISAVGVLDEVRAGERDGADAYIIACFGDPGLLAARELTLAPVIGIAEAAFHLAMLISSRFSVVTTLQRTCHIAEHLLQVYGFAQHCRRVRAANTPVLDLVEADAGAFDRVVTECLKAKEEDGIGSIVLGCGVMADFHGELQEAVGLPVVEGVTAAVKLAESLVALQLGTSKHGDLDFPRPKRFTGQFEHLSMRYESHSESDQRCKLRS